MKKTVLAIFVGVALVLSLSTAASADSFLSITVGATTISCTNSTAAGVAACATAGFSTTVGGNSITTTLPTGISIGGYSISAVNLTGNSPGTAIVANALDSKFNIQDVSATQALVVSFAQNNYTMPAGTPLTLSSSQSGTGTTVAAAGDNETFTGYGDSTNSLVPGTGTAATTPPCNLGPAPPESSCSTASTPTTFNRPNPTFSLSGVETITMNVGDEASFLGTVSAAAPVPEPSSVLLLGTGMVILAGRRLRRKQQ